MNFQLIGIDGGATKVNGWLIDTQPDGRKFKLGARNATCSYADVEGFRHDFQPVAIQTQLSEFQEKRTAITNAEKKQAKCYIEAFVRVISELMAGAEKVPIVVGIGMPGLKTESRRGIGVLANGPRIVDLAERVEQDLEKAGITFQAPIAHLGSDADYCGIGELYADEGSFRDIQNAYYLGGGTGAADALLLRGELVPLDQTKPWLAKTWEMKNDCDISLERYASASGFQYIYSLKSGTSVEDLNGDNIYAPQIALRALEGEQAAIQTFRETAENLAKLLFERITSVYCGSQAIFSFVNNSRPVLENSHPYLGTLFDRIIIGQRLGDLLDSRAGHETLGKPLLRCLTGLIEKAKCLDELAKSWYTHGHEFRSERIMTSPLRDAPALGAGIDAFLSNQPKI